MLGINFGSFHEFIVFEILREELYVNSLSILSRNQILFSHYLSKAELRIILGKNTELSFFS